MKLGAALVIIAHLSSSSLVVSETVTTGRQCDPCDRKLEIGIVLDSSSSLHPDDFNKAKAFLVNYLKNFVINQNNVRVSIITYGRKIHPEDSFNLTTYDSGEAVRIAINLIPYIGEPYTATGEAIRFLRKYQLAPRLTRQGVRKVGIVITDGNSQDPILTKSEAEFARYEDIELWAIGVGHKIDDQELLNIAGFEDRVDRVDSYDKLNTIKAWLAEQVCGSPEVL